MLDRRDQQALATARMRGARLKGRGQRQRIGLSGSRGEDDVARLGANQGCDLLPGYLNETPGGSALTMNRGGIAEFIERAGKAHAVEFINQPGIEALGAFTQRNLDIVFIDALKEEYEEYLELSIPLLKLSGLIVVDNLLWSGRAAQEALNTCPEWMTA